MALTKKISYDQSITESGHIQVRKIIRIMEDGVELSKSYHRWVLSPGDNLSGQDKRVVAIAGAIWTPELIKEYQNSIKLTRKSRQ